MHDTLCLSLAISTSATTYGQSWVNSLSEHAMKQSPPALNHAKQQKHTLYNLSCTTRHGIMLRLMTQGQQGSKPEAGSVCQDSPYSWTYEAAYL